jgi:hypothetical protein
VHHQRQEIEFAARARGGQRREEALFFSRLGSYSMKEIKQKEIEEIQEEIIESAIQWAIEINLGNSKNANKLNRKINKIIWSFQNDKEKIGCILLPLLQSNEPSVRLAAAVHTLLQGIEVQNSLKILSDLEADSSTRGVSLMAYTILLKWKEDNNFS